MRSTRSHKLTSKMSNSLDHSASTRSLHTGRKNPHTTRIAAAKHVFTLLKKSNLPATITVRLNRHLKQFGHTSVRDARASGADEPTRHDGLGDRAGAVKNRATPEKCVAPSSATHCPRHPDGGDERLTRDHPLCPIRRNHDTSKHRVRRYVMCSRATTPPPRCPQSPPCCLPLPRCSRLNLTTRNQCVITDG